MGATDFTHEVHADVSMEEAYSMAVSEAISFYGNNPYNGTISTTMVVRKSPLSAAPVHISQITPQIIQSRISAMADDGYCEALPYIDNTGKKCWLLYGLAMT